jgi:hypothetical protein
MLLMLGELLAVFGIAVFACGVWFTADAWDFEARLEGLGIVLIGFICMVAAVLLGVRW